MTVEQVRELIRKRAGDNQAAWAIKHEFSPSYLSDVLNGRREPGEKILKALGLEREHVYRERAA